MAYYNYPNYMTPNWYGQQFYQPIQQPMQSPMQMSQQMQPPMTQAPQMTQQMPTQATRPNPMQFMGQFMQNPIGALRSAGFNVPNGMNDPRQIVNHLINNGQLGGARLNQLRGMAQMIGKK